MRQIWPGSLYCSFHATADVVHTRMSDPQQEADPRGLMAEGCLVTTISPDEMTEFFPEGGSGQHTGVHHRHFAEKGTKIAHGESQGGNPEHLYFKIFTDENDDYHMYISLVSCTEK